MAADPSTGQRRGDFNIFICLKFITWPSVKIMKHIYQTILIYFFYRSVVYLVMVNLMVILLCVYMVYGVYNITLHLFFINKDNNKWNFINVNSKTYLLLFIKTKDESCNLCKRMSNTGFNDYVLPCSTVPLLCAKWRKYDL